MPDVYHVEGLKHNLLSIGQLIQKGYKFYMEDNNCVIKNICPSNQLIEKVPMISNRLFPLRIIRYMKGKRNIGVAFEEESKEHYTQCGKKEKDNAKIQATFQTKFQDESWLWHFIFEHLNFCGMKLMYTKNMVKVFPFIDKPERVCEGCIFGKQHRENFLLEKSYTTCTPLDIVHSHICGPMQTSSVGACNHMMHLVFFNSSKQS